MYDARELTVEQMGPVLGVSRTSIYRALGKTTRPAPAASAAAAPGHMAEQVAAAKEAAAAGTAGGAAARPAQLQASADGAPVVVRRTGTCSSSKLTRSTRT